MQVLTLKKYKRLKKELKGNNELYNQLKRNSKLKIRDFKLVYTINSKIYYKILIKMEIG